VISRLIHRLRAETAQTTAEYALVILGAAALAGLLITWAGSGAVSRLFDTVLDRVLRSAG
jgi:fatty-acid desaturase